jgi:hypothetical protein
MTTVLRGRYQGRCEQHRAELAAQIKAEFRAGERSNGDVPAKGAAKRAAGLNGRTKRLARAAAKLETAVAKRRKATDEAKVALEEFNEALNGVKADAQELLNG